MKTATLPPPRLRHNLTVVFAVLLLVSLVAPVRAQVQSVPTIDSTFQAYEGARAPIAFQADGKILVTGVSFLANGVAQQGIARLQANGTLDTTFTPGSGADPNDIAAIVVLPDQKILVAGKFTSFNGKAVSGLVRLNAGGTVDSSFTYDGPPDVTKVVVSRSGDLLIINRNSSLIRRHTADGATRVFYARPVAVIPPPIGSPPFGSAYQERFGDGDVIACDIAELPDGKVISAYFIRDKGAIVSSVTPTYKIRIEVFAFASDGTLVSAWPSIKALPELNFYRGTVLPYARLIVTGNGQFYVIGPAYSQYTTTPDASPLIKRYHPDGNLDNTFTAPEQVPVFTGSFSGNPDGALDSSGRLILSGGIFINPDYQSYWKTVRVKADGSIDPSFGIPARVDGPGTSTLYKSENAMMVGIKPGATPDEDRVFAYTDGKLVAYKPTNTLILEGSLPGTIKVTAGKGVYVDAPQSTWPIKWQVSRDGGSSWSDLPNDATYQGVDTYRLHVVNAAVAMSGERYRYVLTQPRGSAASQATSSLTVAPLLFPFPVAIDVNANGQIYVADTALHTIQRIESTGVVNLLAGGKGQTGATDGQGAGALFNQPGGLAVTSTGSLLVSDTANGMVRSITAAGLVTTLAGSGSSRGSTDGKGAAALFAAPEGVAQGADGTYFVADSINHTIRKITADGTVTTFAGTAGSSGASDGTGAGARFNQPVGIAVGTGGRVYVADTANNLIRAINAEGVVTTLAGVTAVAGAKDGTGGEALFNQPRGLTTDASGNLYVADTGNSVIRKVTPTGVVTTLAGLTTIGGLKDGTGSDAWFNLPRDLAADSGGNLYVADTGNAAIRKVTPAGVVTTLALTGGETPAPPSGGSTPGGSSPPPPSTGSPSTGGGGGGGGAPSLWFLGASACLALLRLMLRRSPA